MARYRKRPVIVEAFLWTGGIDQVEDPEWIVTAIKEDRVWFEQGRLLIATLEGIHKARVGDYIIQGVQGEMYPCKPDIFEQTYEEV